MSNAMRIRATLESNGVVDVKVLMRHIMESGQRKDESGKIVPGWYIETVQATLGERVVLTAMLGPAVSKDPYLNFKFKGPAKAGDTLTLSWKDNRGETRSDSVAVQAA